LYATSRFISLFFTPFIYYFIFGCLDDSFYIGYNFENDATAKLKTRQKRKPLITLNTHRN